jgi:N-acetyl-gamma-glutamyl-phosphate reductase
MIKAGIIGAAGYTAGELIRILMYHPQVQLTMLQSSSNGGSLVSSVHHDLLGDTHLAFQTEPDFNVDVLFLCSGHGKSKAFFEKHKVPAQVKIIDLSADFRLESTSEGFIYGLPELNSNKIKNANKVANPGCFATAIELAFLPLTQSNLIANELHVTAITGSTGAGQAPSATSHFSWKNNNVAVYKAFEHQHLAEISETLFWGGKQKQDINFIPVRGNFSRGILATCYTETTLTLEELAKLYQDYYKSADFVHLSKENIDVKQVVNTNKCVLHIEKHGNKAFIISAIDNLLKGASGQAVQNMNLMFGIDPKMGLKLKPVAF